MGLRSIVVILGLTLAGMQAEAQIATAQLVTAFPEPGIFSDPERPGTFLSFDLRSGQDWAARLHEFGNQGVNRWVELRGFDGLEYSDPDFALFPGTYALARGSFSDSEGGVLPFTSTAGTAVREQELLQGSGDLAFINRTTALWTYKEESRLIVNEQAQLRAFRPNEQTLYWLIARDGLKTQTALVSLDEFEDTGLFELECEDCHREYGAINMSAIVRGTLLECGETACTGFLLSQQVGEIRLVSLPYHNRFHALALDLEGFRPIEELLLVPVGPSFDWRVRTNVVNFAPLVPATLPGVYRAGNDIQFAYGPDFALLSGHDRNGLPHWWSLDLAASSPSNPARFLDPAGSGRFAGVALRSGSSPAAFEFNLFSRFVPLNPNTTGTLGVLETRRNPGENLTASINTTDLVELDPRPSAPIGMLSLRSGESELLGKVIIETSKPEGTGVTRTQTRLSCLECVQRAARGGRGRGAADLENLLSRLEWFETFNPGIGNRNTSISFVDVRGGRHFYDLRRDNRFDREWVLTWIAEQSAERMPEVPLEIRFLPVPGLAAGKF